MRVTTGYYYDEAQHKTVQRYEVIGYYATYEEAMDALNEWHKYPALSAKKLTFAEVYDRYAAEKFKKISQSNINNYKAAFKSCEPIHNMKFTDIRLAHLQAVVDGCGKNYPSLTKIKILFNQLYDYAMQHDYCLKDYSTYVDIEQYRDEEAEEKHRIFTTDEIHTLWDNADRSQDIRVILILICAGLRIGELLDLHKDAVSLEERIIRIKRGKNKQSIRIVPLADAVLPFWRELMEREGTFVIPNSRDKSRRMMYASYLNTYFLKSLSQIGISDHFPHDTRYTFVSAMTAAKIQPVLIKRIVGHKSRDITEKVYTHFEIQQMIEAVDTPDWKNPFFDAVSV